MSAEVCQNSGDSGTLEVHPAAVTGMSAAAAAVNGCTSGSELHLGNDLDRISMSTNLTV